MARRSGTCPAPGRRVGLRRGDRQSRRPLRPLPRRAAPSSPSRPSRARRSTIAPPGLRTQDVEVENDGAASTRIIPGYYATFFYDPDGLKLEDRPRPRPLLRPEEREPDVDDSSGAAHDSSAAGRRLWERWAQRQLQPVRVDADAGQRRARRVHPRDDRGRNHHRSSTAALTRLRFVTAFTFITIAYMLSRGIAKASRVLER